jgi:S1-C subfamily serine protease
MTHQPQDSTGSRTAAWRRLLVQAKRAGPFALGVAATMLGLYLYNVFNPPTPPLTTQQVNEAVAEAMAEATPAPAFSTMVFRSIQPSLVLITTDATSDTGSEEDAWEDGDPARQGLGSGVVISERGEILTALHVVEGAERIRVIFADGTESTAEITASQPENDIAVLQPNRLPQMIIPAVMGNPNAVRIGDEAYAVGNPFGLYGSISAGVVSGLGRTFKAEGSDHQIEDLIQIDTAVNPGNSGGPLLNRYGQVIGIVVGILNPTETEFFVGIGFAVPITIAAGGAGAPPF